MACLPAPVRRQWPGPVRRGGAPPTVSILRRYRPHSCATCPLPPSALRPARGRRVWPIVPRSHLGCRWQWSVLAPCRAEQTPLPVLCLAGSRLWLLRSINSVSDELRVAVLLDYFLAWLCFPDGYDERRA